MPPVTPYSPRLAGREPIAAMRESRQRIADIGGSWTVPDFERSLAPGKWTARQILIHLAQTELGLGARARLALTTKNFVAHNFDQDEWMVLESGLSAKDAMAGCLALMQMNIELFAKLSPAERAVAFRHPDYGEITVDWIIHQMAGHHIHHLEQLDGLGNRVIG